MSNDPQLRPLRFCSRCGAALAERMLGQRTRPACPACGFVVYLDPKVACGVLVERDGRVLLVRRRNEPGRGLWCLPCGFEDADEPPERAARREAREEAGLDVALDGLFGIYHYTDDPRGAGILLVFRARCDAAATPAPGDDADGVGFFAPDGLPPISHGTHRRALDDWVATTMSKQPSDDRQDQLRARLRQLILMRETGPKRAAWHAARVRLIWRLHDELSRADEGQGAEGEQPEGGNDRPER